MPAKGRKAAPIKKTPLSERGFLLHQQQSAVHTPQQLAVAFELIQHITHDLLRRKAIRSYSWLPSCRYTSAR